MYTGTDILIWGIGIGDQQVVTIICGNLLIVLNRSINRRSINQNQMLKNLVQISHQKIMGLQSLMDLSQMEEARIQNLQLRLLETEMFQNQQLLLVATVMFQDQAHLHQEVQVKHDQVPLRHEIHPVQDNRLHQEVQVHLVEVVQDTIRHHVANKKGSSKRLPYSISEYYYILL